MIGIAGEILLVIALSMTVLQSSYILLHRRVSAERGESQLKRLITVQTGSLTLALLLLMLGFAQSDFSLLCVWQNSHTDKPLLFKITGSWGNHEGSMLLWAWILSLHGFAASRILRDGALNSCMIAVQGPVMLGILLFIWLTSNPFALIGGYIPTQGNGLNPLLQDIGLAIHPPLLYLGYVGAGQVFMFALAGMWLGRIDRDWSRQIHPWIALSWAFLTLGIGMGSWWAYRELGWGGWWFWDPVENVSLLPWLTLTALLHSNRVLMQRLELIRWTLLLAILSFAMSLVGTFIVRSGVLVSVHSFASDPDRGLFILVYVVLIVAVALWQFARFTTPQESEDQPASMLSRQGFILINNLLLLAAMGTIFLAIIYPLIMQVTGQPSITVGPPYFRQTVLPLLAPLVILAGIAPLMGWRKGDWLRLWRQLRWIIAATALLAGGLWFVIERERLLSIAGIVVAAWLCMVTLRYIVAQRREPGGVGLRHLPMIMGHLALALFTFAATVSSLQSSYQEYRLDIKKEAQFLDRPVRFVGQTADVKDNYGFRRAQIQWGEGGDKVTLHPEIRFYPERQMQTAEASIDYNLWRDMYATISKQPTPEKIGLALYYNPAMLWLWLSFIVAAFAGMMSAYRQWRK